MLVLRSSGLDGTDSPVESDSRVPRARTLREGFVTVSPRLNGGLAAPRTIHPSSLRSSVGVGLDHFNDVECAVVFIGSLHHQRLASCK